MAGTVTVAEELSGSVKKITWTWLSTAGGAADLITVTAYNGAFLRLVTVPNGGGTAPTTLYDVTVTDEDSTDVLMGAGVDRSATVTEQVLGTSLGAVVGDKLTLNVTNAGNAKGGTVHLYVR